MTTKLEPPASLAPETAKWWAQVADDYVLESHHLRLLTLAGEAWDRGAEARALVDVEGLVVGDSTKAHPALAVERASAALYARLMRELDLDGNPLPDTRPPRHGRN